MSNKKETIGMLLDTEHVYGQAESRLTPILLSLCLSCVPIIVYVYFGLFSIIPIWLFTPLELFVILRCVMIIQGREPYRLRIFKRRLYDEYLSSADLMNIKTIHPDGCIEYVNGTIMYLVACFNGTCENEVRRSVEVRKLMENMLEGYVFDIYIHNITMSFELREYYNKVSRFSKNDSARNFIKIIDYTLGLTNDTSMLLCTLFAVKGRRSDWKDLQHQINIACSSRVAKVYKTIYRVKSQEEINYILNRDIDTTISIAELLRSKYNTNEYGTSKVLAYDLEDDQVIVQGEQAKNPIIPEAPEESFHIAFKEDT